MLTPRQQDALLFIRLWIERTGVSPTRREMKEHFGVSLNACHRWVEGLVERGYLRRLPHRARALEVIKLTGKAADTDALQALLDDYVSARSEITYLAKSAGGVNKTALHHRLRNMEKIATDARRALSNLGGA